MGRKPAYTVDQVDEILKSKNILRLSEYINSTSQLKVKCLLDDYEWTTTFSNINIQENGCARCSKHEFWSNDRIDEYLIKNNKTYKRISDYISCNNIMSWQCLNDGNIFTRSFSNIRKEDQPCLVCKNKVIIKWNNTLIDEYLIKNNIPLKRLSDYKSNKKRMLWQCTIDNHQWEIRFSSILQNIKYFGDTGCKLCYRDRKTKWTNETLDAFLKQNDIKLKRIGNVCGYKEKIKMKCLIDNHEWDANLSSIVSEKSGCPLCKNKMEKKVFGYIEKYIKYDSFEYQKRYKFNNRLYIVDFYLEINNKSIIVEYNGKQHYFPIKYMGGESKFQKTKRRDEEMRQYCKENGIYLLEIPYNLKKDEVINRLQALNNL